jgi:MtfA peptidase
MPDGLGTDFIDHDTIAGHGGVLRYGDTAVYIAPVPHPDGKLTLTEQPFNIYRESWKADFGILGFLGFILFIGFLLSRWLSKYNKSQLELSYADSLTTDDNIGEEQQQHYLTYHGSELAFDDQVLDFVLGKYHPYFNELSATDQLKFKKRVNHFIAQKTFHIWYQRGFREMPILIGAMAVQVSFGYDEFLLPHFNVFNIYPTEYLGVEPLRILAGNVQGNQINFSWRHFLEGTRHPADGKCLGLHELAHAFYWQNAYGARRITGWHTRFAAFVQHVETNYYFMRRCDAGLYSETAFRNSQEFWAESVELFFELPDQLKTHYPSIHQQVKSLLHQ